MKDHCLTALLAVAQAGTIRAAARSLNLSQAALTKSLKELEADIGTELLVRSHRGVRLTEAGRLLHDRARVARQQLQMARTEIRALTGMTQERLAVGVTPMVVVSVLSEVWAHFRRLRPGVELNILEGLPSIVVPALVKGELDCALVIADPAPLPDVVEFIPISQAIFHVVAREGHPASVSASMASLLEYEWVLSRHPGSYSERVLHWLAEQGLPPPVRIIDCNSTLTNWQMVSHSDLLTVLPAAFFQEPSIGARLSGLRPFSVALPEAQIGVVRLKRTTPSASAQILMDLFQLYLERRAA